MYEKMYHILFNAVTDSLEEIRKMNFGTAARLLEEAQRRTEQVYMEAEDPEGDDGFPS